MMLLRRWQNRNEAKFRLCIKPDWWAWLSEHVLYCTVLYTMSLHSTPFSLINSLLRIICTPSCHSRSTVIRPVVGVADPSSSAVAVKINQQSISRGPWTEVIRRSANQLIANFTVSLDCSLNPRLIALLVFSSIYAIPSYSHKLIREPSVGVLQERERPRI